MSGVSALSGLSRMAAGAAQRAALQTNNIVQDRSLWASVSFQLAQSMQDMLLPTSSAIRGLKARQSRPSFCPWGLLQFVWW